MPRGLQNAKRHAECLPPFCMLWVGAYRVVYPFLDGAAIFPDGSLKTEPTPRRVVCPYSESHCGHLQGDGSITNWGASRAPGSCTRMGGSQSRVRTPPQSARFCAHPFSCARGAVEQVRFVCAHGRLRAQGTRAGADLGYGRSQESINQPGN